MTIHLEVVGKLYAAKPRRLTVEVRRGVTAELMSG
jgi:hypothetical protein